MLTIKDIKKGMTVMLKETTREYDNLCGIPLKVTSVFSNGFYACGLKKESGISTGRYSLYPEKGDTIILGDRKAQSEFLKEKVKNMKKEISNMEKEIDFLDEYETEEDFVAAKLEAIISAGNAKDPKDRVAAIKEVVKTLKETHYL